MQTQAPVIRKSKVTVPFYSTPSRLHGQTSAEIIKEARASVMSSATVGIKPVFTSRPFTPKEKERKLFGNLKKINDRPPSSISLKNLQSEEPKFRVKLPSIELASKRKIYSTLHYTNNLSLDNLIEDYNAEALEEMNGVLSENLSTTRKSYSCPKEGRLVKAVSYDEIIPELFIDKTVEQTETIKRKEIKLETSKAATFCQNKEKLGNETLSFSCDKPTKYDGRVAVFRFSSLHPRSSSTHQVDVIKKKENFKRSTWEDKNFTNKLELNEKGDSSFELKPSNNLLEIKKSKNESVFINLDFKEEYSLNDQMYSCNEEFNQKFKKSLQKMTERDSNRQIQCIQRDDLFVQAKNSIDEDKNFVEKSVATERKSEYLSTLKKKNETNIQEAQKISVPSEILELYKTAKYYKEDIERDGLIKNSSDVSKKKSVNSLEEYFGEKSNDSLDDIKENFRKIDYEVNIMSEERNEMSGEKEKEKSSLDYEQFVMNNKIKYHVITNKDENKERAYKKWNSKQTISTSEPSKTGSEEGWDLFWKNSYFRNSDTNIQNKVEIEKPDDLDALKHLVIKITGLIKIGFGNSNIYDYTGQLYNMIKKNYIYLDSNIKENVVKVLYRLAESEDPKVVVSLARILFCLKVDHSLSVACKMVFKVARFDTNDHLFLNEEDLLELFLDGLGRASPLDCAESCIYGYGVLKFLTMNHNILSRVLHLGALDLITLHLKMINAAHQENGIVSEQTQHALFQLTGALRHVAAGEGALPLFVTTMCIPVFCKTLQLFQSDEDIVTNISRTLSLLSADENIILVLMSVENILVSITDLMERYKLNEKILIRLSYCLGNIVEHSDLARVQLSRNETSLTILLQILEFYINKDLELLLRKNNNDKFLETNSYPVDDIIVKVIRIIANMSMNPIVGSNLSPATNDKRSLQLIKFLAILLMRKDPGITLLATLGCLNNISYYCNSHSILIDVTQGIERVLELQSEDCQAEAARVLGNLTRQEEIRDLIYSTGGVYKLIKLLTSKDQEVVKCVCGALVNLLLDLKIREQFIMGHGIDKLVEALELFYGDWSLASMVARAIWNSCVDDLSSAMLHNNVEHLLCVLANSLEEENWNDGNVDWEEFAAISTDLLEKINSHLEAI